MIEKGDQAVVAVREVAGGCGDVRMASDAGQADGHVPQGGQGSGRGPRPDAAGVFSEGDVSDEVDAVLDRPVAADHGGQLWRLGRLEGQVGDGVDDLAAEGAGLDLDAFPGDPQRLPGVRERQPRLATGDLGDHVQGPDLAAAVALVVRNVPDRDTPPQQRAEPGVQAWLICLHDEDVVPAVPAQIVRMALLRV